MSHTDISDAGLRSIAVVCPEGKIRTYMGTADVLAYQSVPDGHKVIDVTAHPDHIQSFTHNYDHKKGEFVRKPPRQKTVEEKISAGFEFEGYLYGSDAQEQQNLLMTTQAGGGIVSRSGIGTGVWEHHDVDGVQAQAILKAFVAHRDHHRKLGQKS